MFFCAVQTQYHIICLILDNKICLTKIQRKFSCHKCMETFIVTTNVWQLKTFQFVQCSSAVLSFCWVSQYAPEVVRVYGLGFFQMMSAKIQVHYFVLAIPNIHYKKFKFLPWSILWKVQPSKCVTQLIMEILKVIKMASAGGTRKMLTRFTAILLFCDDICLKWKCLDIVWMDLWYWL